MSGLCGVANTTQQHNTFVLQGCSHLVQRGRIKLWRACCFDAEAPVRGVLTVCGGVVVLTRTSG